MRRAASASPGADASHVCSTSPLSSSAPQPANATHHRLEVTVFLEVDLLRADLVVRVELFRRGILEDDP